MIDWGDQVGGYAGAHRVIGLLDLGGVISITTETIVTVSNVAQMVISSVNQRDILLLPNDGDILIVPVRDNETIIV